MKQLALKLLPARLPDAVLLARLVEVLKAELDRNSCYTPLLAFARLVKSAALKGRLVLRRVAMLFDRRLEEPRRRRRLKVPRKKRLVAPQAQIVKSDARQTKTLLGVLLKVKSCVVAVP